jgi:hypothetical protein
VNHQTLKHISRRKFIVATQLTYPNSPINGYIKLDDLIVPPETFAALRELAMSKAQSPEAMARLLIERAVLPVSRHHIELLDGLPRAKARRAYSLADLDEQPDAAI